MSTRRSILKTALSLLGPAVMPLTVEAQKAPPFPNKPLTLIVPFTPGGAADQFGRLAAEKLRPALGQPVVVENRAGGNTVIATRSLLSAPDDGHSLLLVAASTMVLNPLLMKKPGYAPKTDLNMLSLLAELPLILVVPHDLPVNNLEEFRRYALTIPGGLSFASVGVGSTMHVMGELFSQQMGLSMVHVPYKGSGPAMTDLISNRVQVMFDAPSSSLPMVTAGKLKALAVTTRRRIAALPQVPSISETLPGFETSLWYGIAVRKSTPPEICALLKSDLDRLLDDPDFRSRLESSGFIMRKAASAKQIETFLAGEEKLWSDIIRTKNIALE